jgi:hypothetical protein
VVWCGGVALMSMMVFRMGGLHPVCRAARLRFGGRSRGRVLLCVRKTPCVAQPLLITTHIDFEV